MKLFYLFDIVESMLQDLEAAGIKPDKYLVVEPGPRDKRVWCPNCVDYIAHLFFSHKVVCSGCRRTTRIWTRPPFRALGS